MIFAGISTTAVLSATAEELFLSPNYFGDLIKKETGKTKQEYITPKEYRSLN